MKRVDNLRYEVTCVSQQGDEYKIDYSDLVKAVKFANLRKGTVWDTKLAFMSADFRPKPTH
jgi:hypothetical protein